jgi:hypothetical protein
MKLDIKKFRPCSDGHDYYKTFKTFEEFWQNCHRGDWMLWLAKKLEIDIRPLTLAKAKCAETVIHLMKDERSKNAIKVAIAFGEGKATIDELGEARRDAADAADAAADAAAYAAAAAAAADAAADAADAAAAAADAADAAAADAADAAADAAYADAYAAYADAADAAAAAAAYAARKENWKKTADICREVLTDAVYKRVNEMER